MERTKERQMGFDRKDELDVCEKNTEAEKGKTTN